VVPLGIRAKRLQPDHSAREHFAARLLGAYRICVWKVVDFAQGAVRRVRSDRWVDRNFSVDGCAFTGSHELEKAQA